MTLFQLFFFHDLGRRLSLKGGIMEASACLRTASKFGNIVEKIKGM